MKINFSLRVGSLGDTLNIVPIVPPEIDVSLEGDSTELMPYLDGLLALARLDTMPLVYNRTIVRTKYKA